MNNDIRKVNDVLKAGGIILYPSETGWGIGCDAINRQAVQQLLRVKRHEQAEELVVLLENPGLLDRYVQVVPDIAWDLLEVSINPLTIIFTGAKNIAPELTGKDNNIGIRITKDDFLVKLLQRFR